MEQRKGNESAGAKVSRRDAGAPRAIERQEQGKRLRLFYRLAHSRLIPCNHNGSWERRRLAGSKPRSAIAKTFVQILAIILLCVAMALPKSDSSVTLDLEIAPTIKLARLFKLVGLKDIRADGSLAGKIKLHGRTDNLAMTGRMTGDNVSIGRYTHTRIDVEFDAIKQNGRFLLRRFDLKSPEGSISGSADLYLGSKTEASSINANLQNFNLLPLSKDITKSIALAGRATGPVSLRWRGPLRRDRLAGAARLTLASTGAAAKNIIPAAGQVNLSFNSGTISFGLSSLKALGATLDGEIALSHSDEMTGSVDGAISDLDIMAAQLSRFIGKDKLAPIQLAGPAKFQAKLAGSLKKPDLSASITSSHLRMDKWTGVDLAIDALLRNSQLSLTGRISPVSGSMIAVKGSIQLSEPSPSMNLGVQTDQMPFAALSPLLGEKFPVEGLLTASFQLGGSFEKPQINGSLRGSRLRAFNEPLGELTADLQFLGSQLQLPQIRLVKDRGTIEAHGAYNLDSHEFNFESDGKNLPLHRLAIPNYPFSGIVSFTAKGSGTTDLPVINAELSAANAELRGVKLGAFSATANIKDKALTADARLDRFNLNANVRMRMEKPHPANFQLAAAPLDLALLGINKASGKMDVQVSGSADLDNPLQGQASASIQNVSARFGDMPVGTQGPVLIEYSNGLVQIPSEAAITAGGSLIRVNGSIPVLKQSPSGEFTLRAQVDAADIVKLAGQSGLTVKGHSELYATISGTLQTLKATGNFMFADGFLQLPAIPQPVSEINLEAKLENGAIILKRGSARFGSGGIQLTGELPLSMLSPKLPVQFLQFEKKGPARFEVQTRNLELKSLANLPEEINGVVSLNASGSAAAFNLQSLAADIKFDELKLNLNKLVIQQREPSHFLVSGGKVSILKSTLTGPETNLSLSGSAGIVKNGDLDVQFMGSTDAGLLGVFTRDVKLAGPVQLLASFTGKQSAPHVSGYISIKDGQASMRSPAVMLDSLNARLNFTDNRITIANFRGVLNGGSITTEGSAELKNGGMKSFNISSKIRDTFLEFPAGLRSFFSGDLTAKSADDSILVAGKMRILDSSYRQQFEIGGGLTNFFKSRPEAEQETGRSPFLSRLRFNIAMTSPAPAVVKNNMVDLEATADFRLVGTFYAPSLVGRVNLEEGGRLFLNQRTYYIQQGQISLNNQAKLEPELNIQAETTVSNYDITMQISGAPEKLKTDLSSDPPLSQAEIVSLLLTGQALGQFNTGRDYQMAQASQAFSLLAGQAGQQATSGAGSLLGLTTFRVEPSFIASEITPGARLTLGQDVTRKFRVGYSRNIVNGDDQWLAEYNIAKKFTVQGTQQEDTSYRWGFTHDLRFGGAPNGTQSSRSARRPKIGNVKVEGGLLFTEKTLRDKFGLKAGDRYEFPKVEKSLNRLKNSYFHQNKLEAKVRLERERQKEVVNLTVKVDPGPDVEFGYEGAKVSQEARDQVKKIWQEGVFEATRIDDSVKAIRRFLIKDGYLQASVACDTQLQGDTKKIQFNINPGDRYSSVMPDFPGASSIGAEDLRKALKAADLLLDIYLEPQKVSDYLKDYYRKRGFLNISVSAPQMKLDPDSRSGTVALPVNEGPRFTVGDLKFEGNKAFDYFELWSLVPISSGSLYLPDSVQESIDVVEQYYRDHGFNDVGMQYSVDRSPEKGQANITFQVKENRQSIIRDIRIDGNRLIGADIVKRALTFNTGEALDYSKLGLTRRSLYETGLYSFVDFETEELPGPDAGDKKSVRVTVQLKELSAYRLNYGGYYDTERGPGGIADFTRRSPFGFVASTGLRLRYDSELQQARLYFSQPRIKNYRLKTDLILLAQKEKRKDGTGDVIFEADRVGISLIQQRKLPDNFVFDYGYRYDHVSWTGAPEDPTLFISNTPVARATATLWRDTRDNILNATSGEFISNAFEYGPSWLGSQIGFYKYFGQYFRYVGLDRFLFHPPAVTEKGKPYTSKLVYAGAVRVGVTNTLNANESIISPELFFAGGGTTMRGFEQDKLGPLTTNSKGKLVPAGGEAMFLLNNEIRFPIYGFLGGAVFSDIGNVYRNVTDFSLTDLRKTAGFGLRVNVKYLLLRFDYGFKLDRRPGESGSEFFFSLGQAF